MTKAYIFDVFGTLVDWRTGVAREADSMFAEKSVDGVDPHAFADFWRGRYQPSMERIRSGSRDYVDLDTLHFENLDETLDHFKLGSRFDERDRARLNRAWEKLPPWDDTVAGLKLLKKQAIVAPCSNGSLAMMTHLGRYAHLPWDCILGAGIARGYKPDSRVYIACCDALQMEPASVMMVAAHNDDLEAARGVGLETGFFPRPLEHGPEKATDLEADSNWDIVADDLLDLARQTD